MFLSKLKKIVRPLAYKWLGCGTARLFYRKELLPKVKNYRPPGRKSGCLENILHINTLDCQGGAAKIALKLNDSLRERNYNSKMLVHISGLNNDRVETIPVVSSFKQRLLHNAQEDMGWQDFFHYSSFNIKNLTTFQNADIVHLHNLHGYYFSMFALPELTSLKPTVWSLHDMYAITGHCANSFDCDRWIYGCGDCPDLNIYQSLKKDTTSFLWRTKKDIYERSKLTIVCPSKWLKSKAEKSILGDKDIRLIYNGINVSIFKKTDKISARNRLNLPVDKKILLYAAHGGTTNYWKGGEYIDELYNAIAARDDVLLVTVGGDKSGFRFNNWMDIAYISSEEEMALYYSASDLFVYPAVAEVFGLVIAESLCCGTPVISFNTGAISELIDHLRTGYLAKHRDITDFIKGVKLFLDDQELIESAGYHAEEVKKRFSVERMTDEYLKIYNEIV